MVTARRRLLLPTTLFVLALLPRLLYPGAPVTWDEPKWINRSLRFRHAIQAAEWDQTYLVGHPGVTTMWLGTVGISINCRLRPATCDDLSLLQDPLPETYGSEEALKQLPDLLPAAKLPLAVAIAAGIVAMYLLVRRLLSRAVAVVAAVLIALDPFFLAHSRVLQLDALTTTFMTLSLLTLLVYLSERGWWMLALSGSLAALAALSKSSALFMIPFVGLLLAVTAWRQDGFSWAAVLKTVRWFALWVSAAAVTWVVLWPAMWVDPLSAVQGVVRTGVDYAQSPHENLNFFWGQVRADPGPAFYPVALLFRLTPLALFGLLAALCLVASETWRRRGLATTGTRRAWLLAALVVYVVLFGAFMSVGAKKFDRYLLPVFPALDTAAAVGLVWLARRLSRPIRAWAGREQLPLIAALSALIGLQAISVLAYHPEYLAYYNPLLGGGRQASKVLLIGWGEGLDRAADYLNRKPDATEATTAVWVTPAFAPFFRGHTTDFDTFTAATADYVVFYISDVQRGFHARAHAMFDGQEPEQVLRMHGIDYAWIYRNNHAAPVGQYLDEHARPGDAIVHVDGSVFDRHYAGPLPIYTVPGLDDGGEAEVVATLDRLAEQHRRIWLLEYERLNVTRQVVLYYLAGSATRLTHRSFPPFGVTVDSYEFTETSLAVTPLHDAAGARFGGQLVVGRIGLSPQRVVAGRPLGISLEWQTQTEMANDYKASLIIADEAGHEWGKIDERLLDRDGQPTSTWLKGTTRRDWYLAPVLAGTPPGKYQLQAIVYDPVSLERLPVLDAAGRPTGTEVAIGTVEVARPATPPSLAALNIPQPLEAQLPGGIELLGYALNGEPMTPGERRTLSLFWRAAEDVTADYNVRLRWQDQAGNTWADAILANTRYPTGRWQRGEVVRAQYDLVLPAAAPAGEATLELDLVEATSGHALADSGVGLMRIRVLEPQRQFTPPEEIAHRQAADLGDVVKLLGYDLDRTTVAPGEVLHLTLYWQAQAEMQTSYTVFTHLLDAEQQIVGQQDSLPVHGDRLTTGWLPGETVSDEYVIPVAADAAPGSYTLEVGMYDASTGTRLTVRDAAGQSVPGNRILLDTEIEVR